MKHIIFFLSVSIIGLIALAYTAPHSMAQTSCGDPNAPPPGNACCGVDTANLEDKPEQWGCIKISIWKGPCLSSIFNNSKRTIKKVLTDNIYQNIGEQGVCQLIDGEQAVPSTLDLDDPSCICEFEEDPQPTARLCNEYILSINEGMGATTEALLENKEYTDCIDCFRNDGYWSALGCMYVKDWQSFISKNVFGTVLGIAGLSTLLCIIYASFLLQTSQGQQEQVQNARETLTSCITGLIVIIFSVFILQVIGYDILRLPGINDTKVLNEGEVCRSNNLLQGACAPGLYCPAQNDNITEAVCTKQLEMGKRCTGEHNDECTKGLTCQTIYNVDGSFDKLCKPK